ncbi:hypothetical protein [Terasakiella sp.]|uniref:hypothetical protein n=1 Tax=Terasakiella sp. TaxID=2034861 RepID=UPI003AA7B5E3
MLDTLRTAILLVPFLYCAFAFAALEINPLNWEAHIRWIALLALVLFTALLEPDKEN